MTPMPFATSSVGKYDVLLGRGGKTNAHEGNVFFREEVAKRTVEYLGAKKTSKIVIAKSVVTTVHDLGGRFLTLQKVGNEVMWVEVPEKRAIAKASQALRENLDVRNSCFKVKSIKSTNVKLEVPSPSEDNSPPIEANPLRALIATATMTERGRQELINRLLSSSISSSLAVPSYKRDKKSLAVETNSDTQEPPSLIPEDSDFIPIVFSASEAPVEFSPARHFSSVSLPKRDSFLVSSIEKF